KYSLNLMKYSSRNSGSDGKVPVNLATYSQSSADLDFSNSSRSWIQPRSGWGRTNLRDVLTFGQIDGNSAPNNSIPSLLSGSTANSSAISPSNPSSKSAMPSNSPSPNSGSSLAGIGL